MSVAGFDGSMYKEMLATNHPRRAANFAAQAAHAYADHQNPQLAFQHADAAMSLFLQYQMLERAPHFYNNILNKFHQHGLVQVALAFEKAYGQKIQELPSGSNPTGQATGANKHGRLPAACPKCGAPLNNLEASWIDDYSIECNYCGSTVQTTPGGVD